MKLVLDTNVVIDWLVFNAPFLSAFRDRVADGRVVVLTHEPAAVELARVLTYPALKLDEPRRQEILRRYEALTSRVAAGEIPVPRGFPRCRDHDDDPFLALAWRAGADALVSRDEAVLRLARRASKFGFRILTVPQMVEAVGRLP